MLKPPKNAFWIGSAHPFDLHEAYLCFRSPAGWRLDVLPERAELFITADSRYKLWVNDQFVARGPVRCFPHEQSVDRLDVASHLRVGENVIAVHVYQPGYSHFAYVHRGAAGLLAWLDRARPESNEGCDGEAVLATDTTWRVRRDLSFNSQVYRVSIYGSGVEERNLYQVDGWTEPGYDASGWETPRIVAPAGGYPWTNLRLRELPLLAERETPAVLIEYWRSDAIRFAMRSPHEALLEAWSEAAPQALPADHDGWLSADLRPGPSAFWLFDLGQDFTCQAWLEIEGAIGQEWLAASYAETMRDGRLVISDPRTYCRVQLTDRYWLRIGDQTLEPFAMRGGRYLLLHLTSSAGTALRFRSHVRVSEYPLLVTKPLDLADPQLDDIAALCERTFLACLQDGFVDSVWRESSQWVGDALPQALIMASMSDDVRPLRQVIGMAAKGAYPDGVLPGVLPGEVHAYTVVDYNFTWVELLALYWRLTGDAAFVAAMWPTLVRMLARFQQDVGAEGLIRSQPGRRLFLDWAPVSRQEPSAIYNLHWLLALQTAAGLAEDAGLGFGPGLKSEPGTEKSAKADSDECEAAAGEIWAGEDASSGEPAFSRLFGYQAANSFADVRAALRAAFWHGGRWWDDLERTTCSQLAAALALLTGCVAPDEVEGLLDALAARSLDLADPSVSSGRSSEHTPGQMVLASPFMHHYLFEALRSHGRDEVVVEIIRRCWGRWVEAGYPATWENWNVDFPDGSQCHAFSAHPRYHLAEIARRAGRQVNK